MEILDESLFESRPLDKSNGDVKHYVIREGGFEEMKKILVKRQVRYAAIMFVLILLVIQILRFFNEEDFEMMSFLLSVIIASVIVIITTIFKVREMLKKNKEVYSDYELFLSADTIVREIKGYPAITIPINEIKDILHHKSGNIIIRSKKSIHDTIGIPLQIERYEELKHILSGIMPFNQEFKFINQEIYKVLFIIVLGGSLIIINHDCPTLIRTFSIG